MKSLLITITILFASHSFVCASPNEREELPIALYYQNADHHQSFPHTIVNRAYDLMKDVVCARTDEYPDLEDPRHGFQGVATHWQAKTVFCATIGVFTIGLVVVAIEHGIWG